MRHLALAVGLVERTSSADQADQVSTMTTQTSLRLWRGISLLLALPRLHMNVKIFTRPCCRLGTAMATSAFTSTNCINLSQMMSSSQLVRLALRGCSVGGTIKPSELI